MHRTQTKLKSLPTTTIERLPITAGYSLANRETQVRTLGQLVSVIQSEKTKDIISCNPDTTAIPMYTWGIWTSFTKSSKQTQCSNVITIDIDGLDNPGEAITDIVSSEISEHIIFAHRTSRKGDGIHIAILIDIDRNAINNRLIIDTLATAFSNIGYSIDNAATGFKQRFFIHCDSDIYWNYNAVSFNIPKEEKENAINKMSKSTNRNTNTNNTGTSNQKDYLKAEYLIDKIVSVADSFTFSDYQYWLLTGLACVGCGLSESHFDKLSATAHNYNSAAVSAKWRELSSSFDNSRMPNPILFLGSVAKKLGISLKKEYSGFSGHSVTDVSNMLTILGLDNNFRVDTFYANQEMYIDTAGDGEYKWVGVTRITQSILSFRLCNYFGITNIPTSIMGTVIDTLSEKHAYNSFRDIINTVVSGWDNIVINEEDPISFPMYSKLCDFLGITDGDRKILFRWLVGCYTNMEEDNCYFDEILVGFGNTKYGKSHFFKNVLLEPFTKLGDKLLVEPEFGTKDKDKRIQMFRSLFLFDEELAVFQRSTMEDIKAFTSTSSTVARAAYGHRETNFKRYFSFLGLTNTHSFYNDDTGGRRYLIIDYIKNTNDIPDPKKPGENIKFDWSPIDFELIWKFAYKCYKTLPKKHEHYNIDDLLLAKQKKHNYKSATLEVIEHALETSLVVDKRPARLNKSNWMSTGEIILKLNQDYKIPLTSNKASSNAIGRVLKDIGILPVNTAPFGRKQSTYYPVSWIGLNEAKSSNNISWLKEESLTDITITFSDSLSTLSKSEIEAQIEALKKALENK